ncbi:hypothetical protein Q8A67_010820 [Cirrhinus molitorella]|uniref:Uncharacterized protein n=1 Tax=Cirrhinus molitorella TaxID=172907 RepID=A0AA88TNZ8_9TELE|nr:hypothetical protein Q8A67_010820 [Cirrhinus molitorella]
MTRRYRLLRRRSQATPSDRVARVTSTMLSVLGSTEENELTAKPLLTGESESQEPSVHPPSPLSTPEEHSYPDHEAALNKLLEEYRGHQEGSDPTPNLKKDKVVVDEVKRPQTPEHPTTSRPVRARKATKRAASSPPSSSPSTSSSQQAREGPGTTESNLEGPTGPKGKRLNFRQRERIDTRGRGLLLPVVRLSLMMSPQKMVAQNLVGLAQKKKTAGPH